MQLNPTGQQISLLSLERGTVRQRVRVQFEVTENWTQIAVLEGVAMFETPTAQLNFREGQMARLDAGRVARFKLLRQSDGWSQKRDQLQKQSASAKHLQCIRNGGLDLDLTGSWLQTDDLDPTIASTKPKGLLSVVQFTVALLSPPLAGSRFDAVNPARNSMGLGTVTSGAYASCLYNSMPSLPFDAKRTRSPCQDNVASAKRRTPGSSSTTSTVSCPLIHRMRQRELPTPCRSQNRQETR